MFIQRKKKNEVQLKIVALIKTYNFSLYMNLKLNLKFYIYVFKLKIAGLQYTLNTMGGKKKEIKKESVCSDIFRSSKTNKKNI